MDLHNYNTIQSVAILAQDWIGSVFVFFPRARLRRSLHAFVQFYVDDLFLVNTFDDFVEYTPDCIQEGWITGHCATPAGRILQSLTA